MGMEVPLKALHEAQGLVVTVETTAGDTYRGCMKEIDDYMNVVLEDVVAVATGMRSVQIVLRGSSIRFFVLPPALKFAPFFE